MIPAWRVLVTDERGDVVAIAWLPYDPGVLTTETEQVGGVLAESTVEQFLHIEEGP